MSRYTGKELVVETGGTPSALSNVREVTISEEAPSIDATAAADDDGVVVSEGIVYRKGCSLTLVDDTDGTDFAKFVPGTEVAFIVYPQGKTSSKPKISGTMLVTKRERPIVYNDLVVVKVTFDVNGALTYGTVSA